MLNPLHHILLLAVSNTSMGTSAGLDNRCYVYVNSFCLLYSTLQWQILARLWGERHFNDNEINPPDGMNVYIHDNYLGLEHSISNTQEISIITDSIGVI